MSRPSAPAAGARSAPRAVGRRRWPLVLLVAAALSVVVHGAWPIAQRWWLHRRPNHLFNELSHCLLGAPLGWDEQPEKRLRAVALAALSNQARAEHGDWPMRCQYFGGELRGELERIGQGHGGLARSLERFEADLARPDKIRLLSLDEIFVAADRFGLEVRSAGVVVEPPPPVTAPLWSQLPMLYPEGVLGGASFGRDRGNRVMATRYRGRRTMWCAVPTEPGSPAVCHERKLPLRSNLRWHNSASAHPLLSEADEGWLGTLVAVVDPGSGVQLFRLPFVLGAYLEPPLSAALHIETTPDNRRQLVLTIRSDGVTTTSTLTDSEWWRATMIGPHALWLDDDLQLLSVIADEAGSPSQPQRVAGRLTSRPDLGDEIVGCINGDVTAALVETRGGGGGITFHVNGRWTRLTAVPHASGDLTCGEGPTAILTRWSGGKLTRTRCSPGRCDTRQADVALPNARSVQAIELDGQPLLTWTGPLDELRARRAPVEQLEAAADVVLVDDASAWADSSMVRGGPVALLVRKGHNGTRAVRITPDLQLEPVELAK